jgi:HSP20 family protein
MTTTLDKKNGQKSRSVSPFWNAPANRLFRNDFLDFWDSNDLSTVPSINITEGKNNYKVSMAAPGLKKEDFDIRVDNNVLTISCETETENKEEGPENYSRREYNYSSFSRSVALPEYADTKGIEAKYADGILNLEIPKKPEALKNESQKIEVK